MDIKDFQEKFSAQFFDTDAALFSPETRFKELPEWTSMIALGIILMVDEEYHKTINADDIEKAGTIAELFAIVDAK